MQKLLLALIVLGVILAGCVRDAPNEPTWEQGAVPVYPTIQLAGVNTATPSFRLQPARNPGDPILTPTPDVPRLMPTMRTGAEQYIVQYGDTLGQIAEQFSVSVEAVMIENGMTDPNALSVGQSLVIPAMSVGKYGPGMKIIPDSELVYGPMSVTLNLEQIIKSSDGYLSRLTQIVDEDPLGAAQIIRQVSEDYSINPRLLLALIENRSQGLSNGQADTALMENPMAMQTGFIAGFYEQLVWAANTLNHGYYLWKAGGFPNLVLVDGSLVSINPNINAGTAAIQYFYSKLAIASEWENDVSQSGFFYTFSNLFGYPFDLAIEPLIPEDLTQPELQLPFSAGETWAFTGGPHGGWDYGSAWAALDFAPPGEAMGCVPSDAWVTAVADGLILRTGDGAVLQDLDGDGIEQTGWVILYMHISTEGRVNSGTYLRKNEQIGHPSCEGGLSDGTHVHLARKFNGEWIPADGLVPFNLDGWISSGTGAVYDGYLTKGSLVVEAYSGNSDINNIKR